MAFMPFSGPMSLPVTPPPAAQRLQGARALFSLHGYSRGETGFMCRVLFAPTRFASVFFSAKLEMVVHAWTLNQAQATWCTGDDHRRHEEHIVSTTGCFHQTFSTQYSLAGIRVA